MSNENQLQESSVSHVEREPENISDNSNFAEEANQVNAQNQEGQSSDPSLILGKFKTQDDLIKAYQELQKHQGLQSAELGKLREQALMINQISKAQEFEKKVQNSREELQQAAQKYSSYFLDPSFKQLFTEAYNGMQGNVDIDKMVNLVEGYVSSRIFAYEQEQLAKAESQKAVGSLKFDKNSKTEFKPPKKRIDEMTPKELDDLLEKMI